MGAAILLAFAAEFTTQAVVMQVASVAQPVEQGPSQVQPVAESDSPNSSDGPNLDGPSLQDVPTWSQIARAILLTAVPDKYEDTKHWGMTRSVFDGLQVRQRGFELRLKERRKRVNHGLWYKYAVHFPKPEQNLTIVIDQVQSPSPERFSFAVHITMRNVQVTGQFENWVLGVKGLNFDVVSDVEIHLHATCDMVIRTKPAPNSFLPDLLLDPSIRSVRLDLTDLQTHRIGRVGGDIAEELGNGSRQFIRELIHSQEGRVVKKANEAIQKKSDSLRLPMSKLW